MKKRVVRKVSRRLLVHAGEKGAQNATSSTTRKSFPGTQTTTTFIISLVIVFALGLGAGYLAWGGSTPVEAADAADNAPLTRHVIEEGGNPSIGPADAPVTIIEFSDYQCPYCQRWHDEVFTRLLVEYPDQVRIVYRDLPLGSHSEASKAAEAANCANEQNAFWQYHDKIFSYAYDLGRDAYLSYASELDLDMTIFTECLDSSRYADEVAADLKYAQGLGIGSTPTFFVNGIFVQGALPYEDFKSLIDQELAGELQ
jgi:protein-disulfide isomerase